MKWEKVDYNHLAEDRDRYVTVNVAMKGCIPKMRFLKIINGVVFRLLEHKVSL
jgi:hypothetical protein